MSAVGIPPTLSTLRVANPSGCPRANVVFSLVNFGGLIGFAVAAICAAGKHRGALWQ